MTRAWKTLALTLLLCLAVCQTALAVNQREAVLDHTEITIDLAGTRTYALKANVLPAAAKQSVVWKSYDKNIAGVSSKGVVVAKRKGTVAIGARPSKVNKYALCTVTVVDSLCPDSVHIAYTGDGALTVFDACQLTASAYPADRAQTIGWGTSDKRIATVTQNGLVTARAAGKCTIKAYSTRDSKVYGAVTFTVTRPATPSRILITPADNVAYLGTPLQLTAAPVPDTAGGAIVWSTSSGKIAAVSQTGLVTPKKTGKVKITARSRFSSRVYTVRTLTVLDPTMPRSIALSLPSGTLTTGGKVQIGVSITPATASDAAIVWRISDTELAEISPTGMLTLKNAGRALIKATTVKGQKVALLEISVRDPGSSVSVTQPARITDISGIAANIAKIEAIEDSAYGTLKSLAGAGSISAGEASDRRAVIERAFKMQKFVWMTKKKQPYWSAANSEGGVKDFKPGNVYYGLPYIQRSTTSMNRRYDAARAVSEGRYVNSGSGYFLLNQSKLLGGKYCGSDCSSFVSQAQLVSAADKYDLCSGIASCKYYKTVANGFAALRPGDMIIRSKYSAHVVLFLYYTNAARTRMMIIEQGGGSPGDPHNTISCSIVNVSKYSTDGYRVMRKTSYR